MSRSPTEIAESVRTRYAGTLASIRNDGSRTPEWKEAEFARVYRKMSAERDAELERQSAAQDRQRRRLEDQVFGLGGLSGDAASLAISRRDAGDRAAQLKTSDEAARLLARANRSGDEPLASAIAERAYEMDWALWPTRSRRPGPDSRPRTRSCGTTRHRRWLSSSISRWPPTCGPSNFTG